MLTKDKAHFHIVLVKAWVQKNDKFLLAQRSLKELQKPGTWSLPGGKIEDEIETNILQKTLAKELKEEVGIEISDKLELIYNNSFIRVDGSHVVNLTFICQWKSGVARALEDTSNVKWFTLDDLINFDGLEDFMKLEVEKLSDYLTAILVA